MFPVTMVSPVTFNVLLINVKFSSGCNPSPLPVDVITLPLDWLGIVSKLKKYVIPCLSSNTFELFSIAVLELNPFFNILPKFTCNLPIPAEL